MSKPSVFLRITSFAILLAVLWVDLQAQTTHRFTEGLIIQVPSNYGREAVYTDVLLWNYYQGKLPTPQQGQPFGGLATDEPANWMPVTADTSGFFRPQPTTGGNLNSPNNPAGPGRIERLSGKRQTAPQRRRWRPSYLYLTYSSSKTQVATLNVRGNSAVLVNGTLHMGDPYRMGWMEIPVQLKKGLNEFYVRGLLVAAELHFPEKPVYLNTEDLTLPDIVQGKDKSHLLAGVVVVNTSSKVVSGLTMGSSTQGQAAEATVPDIPPYSTRKVTVPINASKVTETGDVRSQLTLRQKGKVVDQQYLLLRSVTPTLPYRITFVSEIDGSLQYYAVNPAAGGEKPGDALFFSVHGAGVEALGQAQAYQSKDWGTLVAPTNRRPRGFNWEDWGRIDALEVLALARETLQPDTQRIYLTGHSMGGHGTWFLGATYPDKWAAIAPCAGYPTLKGYGSADGLIPEKGRNAMETLLLRSSNQSDVIAYASNYRPLGVYVLHGDADQTVPVTYARQMRAVLGEFHPDFNYYEYPNGSHWYSNESVDWKPLFDYFKWHKRKVDTAVHTIDFKTANPGISASYYWATIYQQQEPLEYSHLVLSRDINQGAIIGTTENIHTLQLDVNAFPSGKSIRIQLDSLNEISLEKPTGAPFIYLKKQESGWQAVDRPSAGEKGPHRNGTFKEAFNHRMVYVYGTHGTEAENQWAMEKAIYDAESWYYRGNGAFDIIADRDFDAPAYADRNVILIGNAKTNSAWNTLLANCPINVNPNGVQIGTKQYQGDDLGGYFVWKKPGTSIGSVGVITGTGLKGMQAATANQYFAGASGFPDYVFFKLDMLKNGPEDVVGAGFYTNQWEVGQ
ncbi:prolyl oligopeptidase family serine peptidase [Parapedobacter indicus]|uniref:Prolyl oligopeptidase family protein n=1 Tax=Parapedobacter indicus TaxID=1477437 RepID=A0A1I3FN04_9SPHI|nr:prolyl oligopeptidase family serine peptidase [Parapedobacter indicus]PPL03801.1 prolyl oligopeptidase family protein [Parapedobacter indicus]SFI12536.1 Prolyl oligopeptidase family protein [Parapedobacter indicus]